MLRRRPGIAWLLLCASLLAAMLPRRVTADADFESVRTGMLEDHSGKAGDPKEKFFRTFLSTSRRLPSFPNEQFGKKKNC